MGRFPGTGGGYPPLQTTDPGRTNTNAKTPAPRRAATIRRPASPRGFAGAAMPRPHRPAPDDDEDDEDDDYGYGTDDGDDDAETVPCPHCGAEVYEDAERCPRCERYLSAEDRPSPSRATRRCARREFRCPTRCCRCSRNCRRRSHRVSGARCWRPWRRAGGATDRAAAPGRCPPSRSTDGRRARLSRRSRRR